MKEPHRKGIANHPDPESCAGGGNTVGEALTGAHAGRVLSREREFNFQVPRSCLEPKATLDTPDWRGVEGPGAVFSRPRAYVEALRARTGRPCTPPEADGVSGRDGKSKT